MPNNAAVIVRVLHRNNLRNLDLADATGLSESTISRMVNGHATVSLEVVRALWQLTNDNELVSIALGDPHAVVVSMNDQTPRPQTFYSQRALASCAALVSTLTRDEPRVSKQAMRQLASDTIAALHLFRNTIDCTTPHPRAARFDATA